ncbi:MAG: DUF4271 domain-containing protein [Bacteroidales bacterium]|jgi:hypothetical protein|nr:DUF4271 domain-containing protein [Bacteroidales bacterium]
MPSIKHSDHNFPAKNEFLFLADTIPAGQNHRAQDTLFQEKSVKDTLSQQDTAFNQERGLNLQQIDSILRKSEERTRQIELQLEQEKEHQQKKVYRPTIDTAKILYREFGIANFPVSERLGQDPFHQNLFLHFKAVRQNPEHPKKTVFIEEASSNEGKTRTYSEKSPEKAVKPLPSNLNNQFDWVTVLLIVTLILFGWIRLFHKKYLLSLIKSTISYQEAHSLYRDKNSLMQRASFIGNLLFVSNVSLFVVQLSRYFGLTFSGVAEYELYLFSFTCITGLYVFRALTSGFIGFLFLKQKVFAEYFHHVNIYTKNIGLFLFPVIVALQFLTYEYLDFIVYMGFGIVLFFYIFQLLRSFQIINRRNVSIFYMILYLCAFEFAPFLILYKMLLTLVN